MAKFDQKGQKVGTQYNADAIEYSELSGHTEAEKKVISREWTPLQKWGAGVISGFLIALFGFFLYVNWS